VEIIHREAALCAHLGVSSNEAVDPPKHLIERGCTPDEAIIPSLPFCAKSTFPTAATITLSGRSERMRAGRSARLRCSSACLRAGPLGYRLAATRTPTTGTDVGVSTIRAPHDVGLMRAFIGCSLATVEDKKAIDQRRKDEHE
jgi:hypothetical protein